MMKKDVKKRSLAVKAAERGYTLLEYCAGAAVLLLVVYGALDAMGQNVDSLLRTIGDWAVQKNDDIRQQHGLDG